MYSESEQTAADLADLTLDDFKTRTTVNLKAFLHLRGKNSEGGQEWLAVKGFSAWCDKVPVTSDWPIEKIDLPTCLCNILNPCSSNMQKSRIYGKNLVLRAHLRNIYENFEINFINTSSN